jgi:hypothetical protein
MGKKNKQLLEADLYDVLESCKQGGVLVEWTDEDGNLILKIENGRVNSEGGYFNDNE